MRSFVILCAAALIGLVSCKSETGKKTTPSGYEYNMQVKGSGEVAKVEDYVSFTIDIIGDNGDTLQSNQDPKNLPMIQIPKKEDEKQPNPLMDVLRGAQVGDIFSLTMPLDSFKQKDPSLGDMKAVYYNIAVKEILGKDKYMAMQDSIQKAIQSQAAIFQARLPEVEELVKTNLAQYKTNKLGITTTASGLKYIIHEEGTGPIAKAGDNVSVHYYGSLLDGTRFDDSFSRGQAITFPAGRGQVISGWDEAVTTLPAGTAASLFIPSDLAYGDSGSGAVIPPKAELMFYIEIQQN